MGAPNLNLFFALIGGSMTAFLGAVIYIHDRKSATNIIFIIHALIGTVWAAATYFSVVADQAMALFWVRAVIFFAVPHVFLFLIFVINFPEPKLAIRRWQLITLLTLTALMMAIAFTPFAFSGITTNAQDAIIPIAGPVMPLFGLTLVIIFLLTVVLVIKKFFTAEGIVRRQWLSIGIGLVSAYCLLIFLVFIRVILANDTTFVPYSPLFILPIFAGAAYAILKHKLFNIKVVATELVSFLLILGGLLQVILSTSLGSLIIALLLLAFVLISSILLIRSVLKEVEQREELQHLNEKLDSANQQLEELSHFKSELLSLASHQIRSPLAAIKGFGTLIVGGSYGPVPDIIKAKVEQMSRSANDLINLINTLLDMRKVEEGKMDYQMVRTDLSKIVTEVVDLLKPLAETKKLEFTVVLPGHEVPVNADPEKLKQVIQNLTDNAIKYTPSGFVHVELTEDNGTAIVTVSDSGVGFSPDLGPHLFEEFIRDERIKKQILGTGLGLYIARKIAEAHGGTVWAESSGVDKGSMFHVKVPEIR